MRDALGGTVTLVIIVAFLVIFLSYMAFNVNYTKAYRMKNKIIATYNDYDGHCNKECDGVIKAYASEIGYRPEVINCPSGYLYDTEGFYCRKTVTIQAGVDVEKYTSTYYKIATRIDFDFPIIRNMLGNINYFWVKGDTKAFKE